MREKREQIINTSARCGAQLREFIFEIQYPTLPNNLTTRRAISKTIKIHFNFVLEG